MPSDEVLAFWRAMIADDAPTYFPCPTCHGLAREVRHVEGLPGQGIARSTTYEAVRQALEVRCATCDRYCGAYPGDVPYCSEACRAKGEG